jgi:hypothetical protein
MDSAVESGLEHRKEWSTPELREIDIEKITATASGTGFDGGSKGSNKS